jgi:hypothetical protein
MKGLPRATHLLEAEADEAVGLLVIAAAGVDCAGGHVVGADLGEVRETVPGCHFEGIVDPRFGRIEIACRDGDFGEE